MEQSELREVHEQQNPAPIDFNSLVRSLPDARDKLLCACIATFADIGLAERFISHLINLPEPIDHNRVMYGIPVKKILGMSSEQAQRAFNLNENEVKEMQKYLGLTDNSVQSSKAYVAGIRN